MQSDTKSDTSKLQGCVTSDENTVIEQLVHDVFFTYHNYSKEKQSQKKVFFNHNQNKK